MSPTFAFPLKLGDSRKEKFPHPTPGKEFRKRKLEGNEIIVFIIFVSCLLCLLCYLQTPNVSFLCFFFSVSFSIWKIQILYNHWWLQCSLPEKWILTQLSLVQLPQPSLCWRLPWLESGTGESCTHGEGTPPHWWISYILSCHFGSVFFCRSGLKATSESWVAPKIS